jgi:hypothetical protein
MQFSDGATASLSMIAFTEPNRSREVNVFGTKVNFACLCAGKVTINAFSKTTDLSFCFVHISQHFERIIFRNLIRSNHYDLCQAAAMCIPILFGILALDKNRCKPHFIKLAQWAFSNSLC